MIMYIIGWLLYGLVVGLIAKAIHVGEDPTGFVSTVLIGICGSLTGGFLSWIISGGGPFSPGGLIMSIVGGVICCWLYKKYKVANP